ncbi:MAG: ATP-binding protein [archaeon]
MFSPLIILIVSLAYLFLMFILALFVQRNYTKYSRIFSNPFIYSLGLAVYCTAWTFYGSIGLAANSKDLFLTVYTGPTIAIILWWGILRKAVRAKNAYSITSIADFISARYNKSQAVAVIVTSIAIIGIVPYIALQLKAIITSFVVISSFDINLYPALRYSVGLVIVFVMALFTILFGVRRIDPTERHPGMVFVIAVMAIVKIMAFIAAGIFITYFVHHGFNDLFNHVTESSSLSHLSNPDNPPFSTWISYFLLSMSAILFLPRQFHMAVVENSNEKHIRTAMWMFPLYMLLINLFVMPIAVSGLVAGYSIKDADNFILQLPLHYNNSWLALFVFIGGLSAAVSMIMICAMTLSTMATNHLFIPLVNKAKPFGMFKRYILQVKWIIVVLILLAAYLFKLIVGDSQMLVSIGMISFAAVMQFAPPFIIGMYWKGGNKTGAIMGLTAGLIVWIYTSFFPALIKGGLIYSHILENGLFGISWLNPERLFGVSFPHPITNTLFFSMIFNIGFYVIGSILFSANKEEQSSNEEFFSILNGIKVFGGGSQKEDIILKAKTKIIRGIFLNYFDRQKVDALTEKILKNAGVANNKFISIAELADLNHRAEIVLSGSIGISSAHASLKESGLFSEDESKELSKTYGEMLASLKLTPEQIKSKIDFYASKEKLLEKERVHLEHEVMKRTKELNKNVKELEDSKVATLNMMEDIDESNKQLIETQSNLKKSYLELKKLDVKKDEFISIAAHELKTPLTSIHGFSQLMQNESIMKDKSKRNEYLGIIDKESKRLGNLVTEILELSRIDLGTIKLVWERVDLRELIKSVVTEMRINVEKQGLYLNLKIGKEIDFVYMDEERMPQVIINLINNSIKFTPKGGIELNLEKEGKNIHFSVKDTGIGIDKEHFGKIFTRFFQVDSSYTRKAGGTGLGLSLCKEYVELMGGKIWFESEVNKGTTFHFTLPINNPNQT